MLHLMLFIRPSGNSMDQKGWKSMNAPGDAVIKTATIGKIHHLEVYVDRTFTAFTQTVIFVYKGTPSNDVFSHDPFQEGGGFVENPVVALFLWRV